VKVSTGPDGLYNTVQVIGDSENTVTSKGLQNYNSMVLLYSLGHAALIKYVSIGKMVKKSVYFLCSAEDEEVEWKIMYIAYLQSHIQQQVNGVASRFF
jgi:hypothetical protein